jgi:hypothetical protein
MYNIISFLKELISLNANEPQFFVPLLRLALHYISFIRISIYTQTGCSNAGAALSITLDLHIMREQSSTSRIYN